MTANILLNNSKTKTPLLKACSLKTLNSHLQSTASDCNENEKKTFEKEWADAKPYDEIPSLNKMSAVFSFLPGGKYYKMSPTDLTMAFKRDLGNIMKFDGYFGRKNMVITYNVEDFVKVFRNEGIWPERPSFQAQQYHREVYRRDFFKGVEGVVTTQGEKWATFRSVVNPVLMQPKNVRLYMNKMSQVNKEFVQKIQKIRDPNSFEVPANFDKEINRWTLESVSVVALDKKLSLISNDREDKLANGLFEAMNDFLKYSAKVEFGPPIWKLFKTSSFKKLMNSLDFIMFATNALVTEAIERIEQQRGNGAPENSDDAKSVLEKLIKVDKKIATVMAMDTLMAGVDTTSSTFAGLLLCLAKNPHKQAKLREEVKRILPHKESEFTEESIKHIPYIKACIKESLRMYPITMGNARVPASDVVLSGYRVPKGTNVTMIFNAMLNDNSYFPRSSEYLPERWLRPENFADNKPCSQNLRPSSPFVYLPFGFGPRSCIGRRIVEMELELGIARLIRNFQIEYNYSTENAFTNLLINKPQIPLTFKFSDINN